MSGNTRTRTGVLFAAAGAALVVGFFLPWVDLGVASASGWDAARHGTGWTHHLLWLAPLAGLGLLLSGASDDRRARSLGILTGALVLGWLALASGRDILGDLRWGGWLALIGAAGVVAAMSGGQRALAAASAAACAVAFFLPWYGGASGYTFAHGAAAYDLTRLAPVWLGLFGALAAGAVALTGRRTSLASLGALGVVAAVAWPYVVVIHLVFGLGAWLTLGGSALALGAGLATRRA